MKKLLFVMVVLGASLGAFAQQNMLVIEVPGQSLTRYSGNLSHYSPNNSGINGVKGPWAGDGTWSNNWTTADGNISLNRGRYPTYLTLTMTNQNIGRIVQVRGNNSSGWAQNQTTTITGGDSLEESRLVGFAHDRNPNNQRQNSEALFVHNNNYGNLSPNHNLGEWYLKEGNYLAGGSYDLDTGDGTDLGGKGGLTAAFFNRARKVDIDGSSFYGSSSSGTGSSKNLGGNGIWIERALEVNIKGVTGKESDVFVGGHSGSVQKQRSRISTFSAYGGAGAVISDILQQYEKLDDVNADLLGTAGTGKITIDGANFFGGGNSDESNIRSINVGGFNAENNTLIANGGIGLHITHGDPSDGGNIGGIDNVVNYNLPVSLKDGQYIGGDAGEIYGVGPNTKGFSFGGYGLSIYNRGTVDITGGRMQAGQAASSTIIGINEIDDGNGGSYTRNENGDAYAYGGHGIMLSDNVTTTINGADATGTKGSSARSRGNTGYAGAYGGSGVFSIDNGTLNIHGGVYRGGDGGSASADEVSGIANADGGSGVTVVNGTLNVSGGSFYGGKAGTAQAALASAIEGAGIRADESELTINQNTTNTVINNGIVFYNNSTHALTLDSATINGDVRLYGSGTKNVTITTNVLVSGKLVANSGIANVAVDNAGEGSVFSDVEALNQGTVNFTGQKLVTASDSRFSIDDDATLSFAAGANLSSGTIVDIGKGTLTSATTNNFTMRDNSSLLFTYDNNVDNGEMTVSSGNLVMSNQNNRVVVRGISSTPTGSYQPITITGGGSVTLGTNSVYDVVDEYFGWLTQTVNIDTTAGIKIDYDYSSLTNNAYLADVNTTNLVAFDALLTDTNNASVFFGMNALGTDQGAKTVRFASSQASDAFDTTLQNQGLIHQQYAARATSFRSVNGFASTRPGFSPEGAAGPIKDSGLQGWIKAYGGHSSRDKDDATKYDDYDATIYGTVIGLDKSWNNLLIGIAGGYAASDLDAGATYSADLRSWHGSIYSTFGNENVYVDLAGTYAGTDVDESSPMIQNGSYKSSSASGYIGAGMKFEVSKAIAITPEASMLATYYEQDAYDRKIISETQVIGAYDEWSYLGAIGLNIASAKKINWDNAGLVFTPEVRGHWLHEFNDNPADLTYTLDGSDGYLGVRARDADMFKLGLGFDIWNWKYQNTMFEIDYDGLFGESFTSHTISGKISHRF